jgi:DNA polymerase-3 subunit gamma/tau
VESAAIQPAETRQPASASDKIVFDASSADALFDLDEDDAGQDSSQAAHDAGSDDFLSFEEIAPLEDEPSGLPAAAETQTAPAAQPALDTAASAPQDSAAQDGLFAAAPPAQAEHTPLQPADAALAAEQEASALMPQDILNCSRKRDRRMDSG